jgi:hypothetical protein
MAVPFFDTSQKNDILHLNIWSVAKKYVSLHPVIILIINNRYEKNYTFRSYMLFWTRL